MNPEHKFAPSVVPRAPLPVFTPESAAGPAPAAAVRTIAADWGLPPKVLETKFMLIVLGGILLFGMILGNALFGGKSAPSGQQQGLAGVIANRDISAPLERCGRTDRTAPCVMYIMNSSRYDQKAENFFDDVVRLLERSKYAIAIENPQYAQSKIPPGHFAMIKVPAIR